VSDTITYKIRLRGMERHPKQKLFVRSPLKRKIVRAGRRGGKTTGCATLAVEQFCKGKRVLYAVPTTDQLKAFWREITTALAEPIDAGVFKKNETEHSVELPGTSQRIRAKSAWNADTLRGDYADVLILDEFQLMAEDAWGVVGAPMLADNDGDAIFIYTPPSFHSIGVTKARDPRHASKMFKQHVNDPAWLCLHFKSNENPHISAEALERLASDMTALAYRQEIEAEDIDEVPGALWTRDLIERGRLARSAEGPIRAGEIVTTKEGRAFPFPALARAIVGVDPPGGATECGIVGGGVGMCPCNGASELHGFVLEDCSLRASPDQWGREVVGMFNRLDADRICGEQNFGGDMVESTIRTVDPEASYRNVHASRGKAVRAEPIAALYEQGKVHHVGSFPKLEDEQCSWLPGESKWSPNRLDAVVWMLTECRLRAHVFGVLELRKQEQAAVKEQIAKVYAAPKITVQTNGDTPGCEACHSKSIVSLGKGESRCSQCGHQWGLMAVPQPQGGRVGMFK
jgi:hypothetical protein